jgi:hypothetical protein
MVIAELHWDVLLVSWLNGLHSGKKRITEIQKVHHMGFIGFCSTFWHGAGFGYHFSVVRCQSNQAKEGQSV